MSGPVFDFDPNSASRPLAEQADTRDPPILTIENAVLAALALTTALAMIWLVRRYQAPARRTASNMAQRAQPYWREIGLFTLLTAIFLKLW